ncbi:30S ribosomal protein S12 methylthiotransferase RimO [Mobilitalea sibirica]|uniref:Ribosomal protein uS12 methylthiotransferase RimO n=1 Tax=Mobilitalea sibirica TaxID=1462919 RepID=A0A8J7H4K9_9FIRM|nr:30S ribosomal protein S12 methylthiotransferase RimO [Mobilitalea sibirica]MBH1942375.1 30S ribosomal protein S12 methylthiotransferase RimO [Mobilitalea sibirica]
MNIFFVSLGCDKNLVDSETMLGILHENGYRITNEETSADIIIVNTCCFIQDAKQESVNVILEMAQYKKTGKLKALIVTGCMAERYKEEITKEIPEVDALLGTSSFTEILKVIDEIVDGKRPTHFNDLDRLPTTSAKRILTSGSHYAYLKIAEGCDKHCTYCVIPQVRGNYRSVPMENLISEAKYLASQGIKELILVAQETTLYGVDLYGEKTLPKLLKELCKVEGIAWIRILYCYPEEITPELIQVMKEEEKICNYLDIPIQHACDRILKLMGRKTNQEDLIRIVTELRNNIPDIVLRTTLITGFPTETEDEHKELLEFVQKLKFERLGVFTYSKEENTAAAKLRPQITAKVKKLRQKELMKQQQTIVFHHTEAFIGKTVDVLIEGKITEEEQVYIGRTYMDAPQVDGFIFLSSEQELMSGDMVKALITGAKNYDLIGDIVKGSVNE